MTGAKEPDRDSPSLDHGIFSVEDCVEECCQELFEGNERTVEILVSRAGEGFFSQHRTRKEIDGFADELIESLGFVGEVDEDK